jgi:cytochrome c
MKTTSLSCAAIAGIVLSGAANAAISNSEGTQLMAKYNCSACHAVDRKLVGPAYDDVGKKYAGDKSAAEKLTLKIRNGSSGTWGPIPMPPNNVPDSDLHKLVDWILSFK